MATKFRWIEWPESCPDCGDATEVYTNHKEEGWAYDEDKAKCLGCGNTGNVVADGDGGAYIEWNENDEYYLKVMTD